MTRLEIKYKVTGSRAEIGDRNHAKYEDFGRRVLDFVLCTICLLPAIFSKSPNPMKKRVASKTRGVQSFGVKREALTNHYMMRCYVSRKVLVRIEIVLILKINSLEVGTDQKGGFRGNHGTDCRRNAEMEDLSVVVTSRWPWNGCGTYSEPFLVFPAVPKMLSIVVASHVF